MKQFLNAAKNKLVVGGGDGVAVLEVESKRGGGCNFLVLYFFGFELYSSSCLKLSLIFLKCREKLLLLFCGLYIFSQSNCHRSVFSKGFRPKKFLHVTQNVF